MDEATTNGDHSVVDVVIVGGGQAGLSTAYHLRNSGLDVVVLERGNVGETWRSQRWDSFCLNTPNWMNGLPGAPYAGPDPHGFMTHGELIDSFETYVERFALPVETGVTVSRIETSTDDHRYEVMAMTGAGERRSYVADSVVVASGILQAPRVPAASADVPESIAQLHTGEYRNAQELRDGAVVVVGGGQSGAQIVEDLVGAGRAVYFSISGAGRVPRRVRGRDVMDWWVDTGFWDVKTTDATPEMLKMTNPLISGVGSLGHSVSYQQLAKSGVGLLGRFESVVDGVLLTDGKAAEYMQRADEFSREVRDKIDRFIVETGCPATEADSDAGDEPLDPANSIAVSTSLDLEEAGVSTIIWSTGFTADFSWIDLPVTDAHGRPQHRDGVSEVPGIYFLGFPWVSKRKSSVIYGVDEDAQHIAGTILADAT